jgi:hypothetical protein
MAVYSSATLIHVRYMLPGSLAYLVVVRSMNSLRLDVKIHVIYIAP